MLSNLPCKDVQTCDQALLDKHILYMGFPGGSEVKVSACNAGDVGSIPGSGRSPGEGNVSPLQYSCLENPMDGGAWWATVHGVAKSRTRLSDFTHSLTHSVMGPSDSSLAKTRLITMLTNIYFTFLGNSF